MNEYEKVALETRKEVSKLTLYQQREILRLYENAISDLAKKASMAKNKSLGKRWLLDYNKEIAVAKKKLSKDIFFENYGAIGRVVKYGNESLEKIMIIIFGHAGIDLGDQYKTIFSQINKDVMEDIISGRLYKDNKTLSMRIWDVTNKFQGDIQYIINKGILEKKSALELARDLEKLVEDPAKRPWSWGKVYPNLRNTKVDYNAQRLARTAINHSYQTSTIKSSSMNPFIEGIEWRSAMIHSRTCELCISRHGQVFPKDSVPLDHPNGLCTMLPYIPKSLDVVAGELRNWLDGGNNRVLDKWYNDYGGYFAFKRL